MKNFFGASASVLLMSIVFGPFGEARSEDVLYFTSSPTSWVGQGETVNEQVTSVIRYFDQGAYTNAIGFMTSTWHIYFVGPNMSLVTVGSYPDATRWPFQGSGPGLSLSGDGRGDNTLTGHFEVLDASYDENGQIEHFAANFVQYDEGVQNDWNQGYVHYHYPVPEPSTSCLLVSSLLCLGGLVWKRQRQSVS